MSRIICISFHNIDWYIIYSIRHHFYYLCKVYIINLSFLSYFDHDRKYHNFIRIIVHQSPWIGPCSWQIWALTMVSSVNYHTLASRFAQLIVVKREINLWYNYATSENIEFFIIDFFYQLCINKNNFSIREDNYCVQKCVWIY